MMNGIGVNLNNQNYQTAFRAKGDKAIYETVDQMHIKAKDFLRPAEEIKENIRRRGFLSLKNICPYVGKIMKPGEATIEHITQRPRTNKLVEYINEAHRKAYLEELKQIDPERYKKVLQKYCEEMVAGMSTWEMIKEIAMNMLKKS